MARNGVIDCDEERKGNGEEEQKREPLGLGEKKREEKERNEGMKEVEYVIM